jgi:tryptophan synthase beta chain
VEDAGWWGAYGGRFVPETLVPALDELEHGWREVRDDEAFWAQLDELGRTYAGRPTPLTLAERFSPGKRVFLKREDLLHTGAHKLNNALGQALLATRLGKGRVVAETGAGQHGVATATVCARFGLECVVFMGAEDMRRQQPNVERMGLLGAEVRPVELGTRTLKEAMSEAIREWITEVETTYYLIGSCAGPAPYPEIVRSFQTVVGREAREQMLDAAGRLPEAVLACVGGGSNAIGMFAGFLDDPDVRLVGVEAAGAASLVMGRRAILHGSRSSVLTDEWGQVLDAHSIAAGLDYPGVGPEHAWLRDTGRASYVAATDEEALAAFERLPRTEGIIPALETAHALARVHELDAELVLVCLSGRGDKDLSEALRAMREGSPRARRPRRASASSSTSCRLPRRPSSRRPPSRAAPTSWSSASPSPILWQTGRSSARRRSAPSRSG